MYGPIVPHHVMHEGYCSQSHVHAYGLYLECPKQCVCLFLQDRTVAVWDFKSPTAITLRMVLKGHRHYVMAVDLTDTYIISGSWDGSIKVQFVRALLSHVFLVG